MKIVCCIIYCLLISFILVGCDKINSVKLEEQFTCIETLYSDETFKIDEDSLGNVEDIQCNGGHLIVYNVFDGYCYSMFDAVTGKHISRFGILGQGPGEILLGGNDVLKDNFLYVFNDQIKKIWRIEVSNILQSAMCRFTSILDYNVDGAQFSDLIPINDSIFIGAGFYETGSQFVLFDKNSKIIDIAVDSYNKDRKMNDYFKYLSNQGQLVMNPNRHSFAYSVNFSSNIDFFQLKDNKIICERLIRMGNPKYDLLNENGTLFRVVPSLDAETGYIDLSSSSEYVYALYSNKKLYENWRKSNVILVFDWDGKPIMKYVLDKEVYHIAINEKTNKLYAVTKNEDGSWSIVSYNI